MSVNFFGWIREGVRQSVLLGVSDAIEQLGTPAPTEDLHPSVVGFLQGRPERPASPSNRFAVATESTNDNGVNPKAPRKRLGKSLKDITPTSSSPSRSATSSAAMTATPPQS